MNEELKEKLSHQGERLGGRCLRYERAKLELERFDANARIGIRGDGIKRTESDVEAMVKADDDREPLATKFAEAKAEFEGFKVTTQCLLAQVSLVCSETAAMSRISQ